jgi:hypothetical protein
MNPLVQIVVRILPFHRVQQEEILLIFVTITGPLYVARNRWLIGHLPAYRRLRED